MNLYTMVEFIFDQVKNILNDLNIFYQLYINLTINIMLIKVLNRNCLFCNVY